MPAATHSGETSARHRPRALTVFAAAFVAGAAAAVGVNRLLDVHLARSKPQIECEPIFVALRSLPQGAPVTVWDVALRDWPKAMLPTSALRAHDSFEGLLLRHPLREGQPLLSVQLMPPAGTSGTMPGTALQEAFVPPVPATPAVASPQAQADLWTPAEPTGKTPTAPAAAPAVVATTDIPAPQATESAAEPSGVDAPAPAADDVASVVVAAPPEAPTPAEPEGDVATDSSGTAPAAADAAATDADNEASQPAAAETLPSVVTNAASDQPPAAAEPSRAQPRRYLVVPERIALQADTSFSAPPPVTTATTTPVAAPVQTDVAPVRSAPGSAGPATPRASGTGRSGQAPTTRQRPPAKPGPQAQPSRGKPTQAPQRNRPAPATNTTSAPQRTWTRPFPNVAAGLEAIGQQWQQVRSGDEAVADGMPAASGDQRRR